MPLQKPSRGKVAALNSPNKVELFSPCVLPDPSVQVASHAYIRHTPLAEKRIHAWAVRVAWLGAQPPAQ